MALNPFFREQYSSCGCFEFHASGSGLVRVANEIPATADRLITGKPAGEGTQKDRARPAGQARFENSRQIFEAREKGDPVAAKVLDEAVMYWGMAAANLVSIFNPGIVVFGGGLFGPASRFLEKIRQEASRWAQPVSMEQVRFEISALGGKAGLTGAGRLALMAADD